MTISPIQDIIISTTPELTTNHKNTPNIIPFDMDELMQEDDSHTADEIIGTVHNITT